MMVLTWMKESRMAAAFFVLLRLYIGMKWLSAGWGKLTGEGFSSAGFMANAVENPITDKATGLLVYPVYTGFLEHFALPNAGLFNLIIPIGEFLVGLGLILGAFTSTAVLFGLLMNFMFLLAGSISTNPWMVLLGGIILIGGANAGKFGLDHYLLPYMKTRFQRIAGKSRNGGDNPIKPTAG
ncbi:DoxX family protein [Paenibacillus sp. BIHB 4019]|nr:DoxX family protein [Paenibacillus sp. BIHB 4019]